ncbi:MAG TPA: hypothetical protein PKV72_03245 [Candidatus Peribacteria bacterium]|nr:hypothetical protein [Candidatus Peribacteria bacterium]
MYLKKEVKRLTNFASSPFAAPAAGRSKSKKALDKITRVKA